MSLIVFVDVAARGRPLGLGHLAKGLTVLIKLVRPVAVALGVGTALTAFGAIAPATATDVCDGVTPISPTQEALSAALNGGDDVICISAGTMQLDSFYAVTEDTTIKGVGEVVMRGDVDGIDTGGLYTDSETGESTVNLTIDNITFSQFFGEDQWAIIGVGTPGTITVLNSTFTGNDDRYSLISGTQFNVVSDNDIVIENTVFENNFAQIGLVWGFGDISVTSSQFTDNFGSGAAVQQWEDVSVVAGSVSVSGNYFGDNEMQDSVIHHFGPAEIVNNTFYSNDGDGAITILYSDGAATSKFAFNTIAEPDEQAGLVAYTNDTAHVNLLGNIFSTNATGDGGTLYSEVGSAFNDLGGNFFTSALPEREFDESSRDGVAPSALELGEPAENDGSTLTMALGDDSVAMNSVPAAYVELAELDLTVDQRGVSRGDLLDAGAWDDGVSELAATGVDATGIALVGGVIGAAGVAIAARRRRTV